MLKNAFLISAPHFTVAPASTTAMPMICIVENTVLNKRMSNKSWITDCMYCTTASFAGSSY